MATIGLGQALFSIITEDANGQETYGTPEVMAKADSGGFDCEQRDRSLYADDGVDEIG